MLVMNGFTLLPNFEQIAKQLACNIVKMELSPMTAKASMILCNTISFSSKWHEPFDERATFSGEFLMDDGSTKLNVSYMSRTGYLDFMTIPELDAAAVRLPFGTGDNNSDTDQSMVIILPNRQRNRSGIAGFEKNLPLIDFHAVLSKSSNEYVKLNLPKFSVKLALKEEVLTQALKQVSLISKK